MQPCLLRMNRAWKVGLGPIGCFDSPRQNRTVCIDRANLYGVQSSPSESTIQPTVQYAGRFPGQLVARCPKFKEYIAGTEHADSRNSSACLPSKFRRGCNARPEISERICAVRITFFGFRIVLGFRIIVFVSECLCWFANHGSLVSESRFLGFRIIVLVSEKNRNPECAVPRPTG